MERDENLLASPASTIAYWKPVSRAQPVVIVGYT